MSLKGVGGGGGEGAELNDFDNGVPYSSIKVFPTWARVTSDSSVHVNWNRTMQVVGRWWWGARLLCFTELVIQSK